MGQKPCCESSANKKNLINQNDSNTLVNGTSNPDEKQDTPLINQNPSSSTLGQSNLNNLGNSVASFNSYNSVINQNYQCIQTFTAHDDKIVSLIELSSGYIATGSYDNTIKIWDFVNEKLLTSIQESGHVLCLLEFEPNLLLCGTDENYIQLWDINNPNRSLFTFEGHLLWVNCLVKCNNDYFASGSNDSDIRIWNWQEKSCVNVL